MGGFAFEHSAGERSDIGQMRTNETSKMEEGNTSVSAPFLSSLLISTLWATCLQH